MYDNTNRLQLARENEISKPTSVLISSQKNYRRENVKLIVYFIILCLMLKIKFLKSYIHVVLVSLIL